MQAKMFAKNIEDCADVCTMGGALSVHMISCFLVNNGLLLACLHAKKHAKKT